VSSQLLPGHFLAILSLYLTYLLQPSGWSPNTPLPPPKASPEGNQKRPLTPDEHATPKPVESSAQLAVIQLDVYARRRPLECFSETYLGMANAKNLKR
jgi:hypothetical protein